jgi:iron(III) transport system substrate-binding protein
MAKIAAYAVSRFGATLIVASLFALAGVAVAGPLDKSKLTEQELIDGSKAEGGTLVFYTSIPVKSARVVMAAFEKKYPWAKTSFLRKGGPVLAQQFYADKKSGVDKADVVNSGAAEVYPDFRKKGFLAKINNLPEWDAMRDVSRDRGGTYVSYLFISQPMFWNTKLLKEADVPDDLWEFTKPQWKDKMASGNPVIGGAAMNWYSWVCDCRKQVDGGTRPPSGLGEKWMMAMHKNNMVLPGQVGPLTNTVVTGQAAVGVSQWMGSVTRAIKDGAPIDYKYPKQGTIGQHWVAAVNAKAPNPYTARLFLNWLLSKDAQILLIEELGAHSGRTDIVTHEHFPLKRGAVTFDKLWIMDLEAITAKDTKKFVSFVSKALTGKEVK